MRRLMVVMFAAVAACAAGAPFTVRLSPGDRLEKGRQAIRDARKAGTLGLDDPATVILAPGDYEMRVRFELAAHDGGTSARGTVTYKAEKPGTVRLRGGRSIPRSAFKPAEGLPPGVLVADAAPYLVSPPKDWKDVCEGVPPGPWLYANGSPLPLARWPNSGWAVFTNAVNKGVNCPGSFQFVGDRTKRWDVSKGLWMTGYWTHDWADTYHRVKSIDLASNIVAFAGTSVWGVGRGTWGMKGRRFYAVNVLSELDAPGEWFLDRKAKKLYYMPDPEKGWNELVLASLDRGFVWLFKGVRHVRFENLDFEYSHAPGTPAFLMDGCADVRVSGCSFSNIAGSAVKMSGERCVVSDCRIWNTGGTAVTIDGGDRAAVLPALNELVRTDIGFYGTFKRTFAPAVHLYGCGSAIRHCRFHDGPYIAVWYYGNEHLIAENVFERVVLEAGDSSAIYSGRDASSWGNLVFGNTIRELGANSEMSAFRMGMYLDDCDCGDSVIGNTFSGIGNAMLLGGGNGLLIANNVATNCIKGILLDSRGNTWKLYKTAPGGNSWWHNMLKPFDYRAYPWRVLYPDAVRMVDNHPNLPWMNVIVGNDMTSCKTPYSVATHFKSITNRMTFCATPRVQPVALADAQELRLEAPGGRLSARFALDAAGRLSWSLQATGFPVVATSPLGFTADGRDFGKLVVPGVAVRADGPDYSGASMPLRDLVSGEVVAALEARLFADRAAWRWRVPGSGRRHVGGEGSAWCIVPGADLEIVEEGAAPEWPKAWCAKRGGGAFSLVYPLTPTGFDIDGEVVTPWRVTRLVAAKK